MLSVEKEKNYNIIERTYIDSKVAHVRWKPEDQYQVPNYFISGTCDEDTNYLALWKYPHSYWTRMVEDPEYQNFVDEMYPLSIAKYSVSGDVTGLKFINHDKFLFCTSTGDFGLMGIKKDDKSEENLLMDLTCSWINDYIGKNEICSYIGFDVNESIVCAVNKLGHIFLLSIDCAKCIAAANFFEDGASCVSILNEKEILVGNLRGQLSIWDTRDMFHPAKIFPQNSQESIGVTCTSVYPVQKHILVSAGLDGAIVTWDLRKACTPLTVYEAHNKPVTCLEFHDSWPTNLFTSSMSGEVWHWTNFGDLISSNSEDVAFKSKTFFTFEQSRRYNSSTPNVQALIGGKYVPTTSLDVIKDQLICSTDNDTFVFVRPLNLG